MTTTTTMTDRPILRDDLPELTATDRLALTIGTLLILRAERHRARRADRAEHARAAHAEAHAAATADAAFERRAMAGPTW
ncbi:hypothetical protein [Amnibacterium kyonggiense]|uniref:Uncharacterized protein n=1 Tax=Amnibacterium kyonggiense TaxID=595671 RepID=A0A4R7FMH4_9MICO|nr:hypothetical protein [Amnibacterium kyonggiense]TDS77672.1 hypothetical protein CLV52_2631 [Amnibacterium kyonggiense]